MWLTKTTYYGRFVSNKIKGEQGSPIQEPTLCARRAGNRHRPWLSINCNNNNSTSNSTISLSSSEHRRAVRHRPLQQAPIGPFRLRRRLVVAPHHTHLIYAIRRLVVDRSQAHLRRDFADCLDAGQGLNSTTSCHTSPSIRRLLVFRKSTSLRRHPQNSFHKPQPLKKCGLT